MKELVSPKQVARAIGVSESSLKRWCDRGLIPIIRTAGGHRKLPIKGVLEFLRESGRDLVEPAILGLPATTGQGECTLRRAKDRLKIALLAANESASRQIVYDLYLAGNAISAICDEVIAEAFHEIGDLWDCGEVEVYEERMACEMSLRVLHEIRNTIAEVRSHAPTAIGGTLDGDPYALQTNMVELVLRSNGWNTTQLGNMLPFFTLRTAIEKAKPQLFWLSVSAIRDTDQFIEEEHRLFETATENGTALVVGGVALNEKIRKQMKYTAYCDTMKHLETFAASVYQLREPQN